MSLQILIADRSSSRAGGTSVEDEDDEVVATIPIKVPLPALTSAPETATTPVAETTPVLSDVELLSAFVQRRDPVAFTQIVERYGSMVYRVAIRAVDDAHLADDVFQATFLVLAQSAHKIRSGEVLPAWLHGTARNIARRVFAHKAAKRRQLAQLAMQTLAEKGGEMTPSTELDPFDELVRLNEQQLLDEELQQLPEASRAPLVLFYLEGKTQAEIARQMGLSVEAIEGRLRRAKQELRQRLIRRGVFLSTVVAAATVLTPSVACAAPASTLMSATLATALGTTAVGTSLLGGTAASTSLTAGATTAAKLAAQEVAAMSAASKATAIFLTTAASTTVATGLLFGAIAGSLCGVPGLAPARSDSSTVETASPLNLVREVGEPDPFALEREQPILLALGDPKPALEAGGDDATAPQPDAKGGDHEDATQPVSQEDLAKLVKERDELVRQKDAEIAKWRQAYRGEQVEKEDIHDKFARLFKEYKDRVTRLNQIVDSQRQQLEELQVMDDCFPEPDGRITTVAAAYGTVWLDIGQKDHLRKQVTFSVYRKSSKGIGCDTKDVKAKIEVVEVRENSSIARIVEEDRVRPIKVGDLIFSPAWSAGLTEHFAIVGQGDLDGDGEKDAKDRQILKDLLDNAGAKIGLEITAEGLREPADAKLTADTKWLIIGDVGDPTTALNDPEKLKRLLAVQKQHELLVQEARELGIKIVSLKDFLTYLGWKPESRVYLPGAGVPFNLKAGALPPALNELAQAPVAMPQPAPVTDEMKQFLTEWDTQNQKITTLESSFTRFEFDEVFGTETRSTGKFYLERPDRWRIDFEPADAALLAKPAGRSHANGTPFKVKPGESSKWICTGKRLYILDVANKAYDVLDIPPQGQGGNQIRSGLPHSLGGPLPFLFFLTAQDAKQLFSLRFGELHNPPGDRLAANGKPRRQAIHVVAHPVELNMAKFCSQADVIFDADTYLPLNLRTIGPARNKETVYGFDQSKMKVGVKWELKSPFHEPTLPGWEERGTKRWPLIQPPSLNDLLGMQFSDRVITPPAQTPAPASVAKAVPITNPETEVELAIHEIRLLQFPVAIAKAEVQYDPVLEVEPARGQLDTLHLRAIMDGRCLLTVTGTNDAVYRVGITAGTPPKHRFRELDSGEEKALNALQGQVSLEFNDTSLKEICQFMTQHHNLPFTLDTEALKAAGADPDLHVSITANGLTLAQALTTMLETVKKPPLDYYIDGGTIHISTVAAMKERERLVYYHLASLSPEGQAAAEKYITPLATAVAPLEGDLLVDASVDTHKKFEEYLPGTWRLESQRPARAIPLGLSARSNRSQGTISPAPRTSPPEGTLPKPHSPELPLGPEPGQNPPNAIGGENTEAPEGEEVFVSLKLFEVDEAGFRELADEDRTEATLKLTPKPDFPKQLRTLTREKRARLLEELTLGSPMGQLGKFMTGGDFPVPAAKNDGDEPARQHFGITTEMTPIKRDKDGRLVLKYDLEFSDRNFNNSIQTEGLVVPNVVAKVFRGFSILPIKGKDGILIGPVATVSRSENDQPARNVSTYLWMREEVDNPIPRFPDPSKRP